MPPIRDVVGYCPMGCGPHLHVMSGGLIMCLAPGCPDPGAVTGILSDPEHLDVVTFSDGHFNVLHPLRERIGGALLSCPVADALERISGPPENYEGRRYRASLDENERLVLKRIEEILPPDPERPAHDLPLDDPRHRCVQGLCDDHAGKS